MAGKIRPTRIGDHEIPHVSGSHFELLIGFNRIIFFGGAVLSCIGMCALIAAGFWEMIAGILVFFGVLPLPAGHISRAAAALELSTKALEFFFLAPLAYALMLGVARYVEAATGSARNGGEIGSTGSRQRRIESARSDLLVVKAFSASLFIAVFAAVLLGKALSQDGINYETALCGAVIILVLSVYLLILEHSSEGLRSYLSRSADHNPDSAAPPPPGSNS